MNRKNVLALIKTLESVPDYKFDITVWQTGMRFGENPQDTIEGMLHHCGTSACVAGWMAVTPEFIADGGKVEHSGKPFIIEEYKNQKYGRIGEEALAYWLDIPWDLADDICATMELHDTEAFYGVNSVAAITPEMVVAKLYELLEEEGLTFNG